MHVGLIGLGRMGAGIRARLEARGHTVTGFDADPARSDVPDLPALAAALPRPRLVWMMLPAGDPTETTVQRLGELLEPDDLVIDGSNSPYADDLRNAGTLRLRGIRHLDCGVSGGVAGREAGYGLMVGGEAADVAAAMPVFDSLRPPGPRELGFSHAGTCGAGHYAKMVHNGIEYGLMQAYAEGYALLASGPPVEDPVAVMRAWSKGTVVRSWLLDLAVEALEQDPHLLGLRGVAEDSGEGRWALQEAAARGVPTPALAAALFARFASQDQDETAMRLVAALRAGFGGHAVSPTETDTLEQAGEPE